MFIQPSTYCTCEVTNKVNKHGIPMYNNGAFNMSVNFPTSTQAVLTPISVRLKHRACFLTVFNPFFYSRLSDPS